MVARTSFLLGGAIGPNLNDVSTDAKYNLGARRNGSDGSTYVYVKAAGTITSVVNGPNAVAIDEDFNALLMTTALALANHDLGFAPIAATVADVPLIPSASYFWAQVQGANSSARVSASASADSYLRTTVTAGRLGTASTASAVVFSGVCLVTVASASTSAGNSVREVLMQQGRAVRQAGNFAGGTGAFVN